MNKKDKEMQQWRAREDLKLQIVKLIGSFKSKEEPEYEINETDVIHVLASLITRRTE